MYVSIEKYTINSEVKAVYYEIEIGFQYNSEVRIYNSSKRYSELLELEKIMKPILKSFSNCPKFPPKKYFNNFEKAFLEERTRALQAFLGFLCQISSLLELTPFTEFFKIPAELITDDPK